MAQAGLKQRPPRFGPWARCCHSDQPPSSEGITANSSSSATAHPGRGASGAAAGSSRPGTPTPFIAVTEGEPRAKALGKGRAHRAARENLVRAAARPCQQQSKTSGYTQRGFRGTATTEGIMWTRGTGSAAASPRGPAPSVGRALQCMPGAVVRQGKRTYRRSRVEGCGFAPENTGVSLSVSVWYHCASGRHLTVIALLGPP